MSLIIFQNRDFPTQHEREAFNILIDQLSAEFANTEELVALIGNFNCGGSEIDATIIKKDAIIIIDFKNYGGQLSFKENGAWFFAPNTPIEKTGNYDNPFQQLKDYRNKFINFLSNENIAADSDPKNLRKFIKSLVIFHKPISIKNIPYDYWDKYPWLRVTDLENVIRKINEMTYKGIELKNDTILAIPQALGISEKKTRQEKVLEKASQNLLKNLLEKLILLHEDLDVLELITTGYEKYTKEHEELILSFEHITTFRTLQSYINSTKLKSFDEKCAEFRTSILNEIKEKVIDIQNLNVNTDFAIGEKIDEKLLLDIKQVKEIINNLENKPGLTEKIKTPINLKKLKAVELYTYHRGIYSEKLIEKAREEIKKEEDIIKYLHSIFEITRTWFAEDMIQHWSDGSYGRTEHDSARGFSSEWYENMINKLGNETQRKYIKHGERERITELNYPNSIYFNTIWNEIFSDMDDEVCNSITKLFQLDWSMKYKINQKDIYLIEQRTKFVFNLETDSQILSCRIKDTHRPNDAVYEPSYISLLENIGQWGYGTIPKNEEAIRNSFEYINNDKLKNNIKYLIDIWHQYKPTNRKGNYTSTNTIYVFDDQKIGKNICKELNITREIANSYLQSIKSIRNGGEYNELNIGNRYYILLLKEFIKKRASNNIPIQNKGNISIRSRIDKLPSKKTPPLSEEHNEITGYNDIKKIFEQLIERIQNPEEYLNYGIKPPGGIILYGPPGCGKTLWANWFAKRMQYPFREIRKSDFADSYVDGALKGISEIIEKIKKSGPAVIFFDEFDDIGGQRKNGNSGNDEAKKVVNYLLQEIPKLISKGIIIIAATNFLDDLDTALTRSGRFDDKIPIFPPLPNERGELLYQLIRNPAIVKIMEQAQINGKEYWYEIGKKMLLFSNSHIIKYANEIKIRIMQADKDAQYIDTELMNEIVTIALSSTNNSISLNEREDFKKFYKDLEKNGYQDRYGRMQNLKDEINSFWEPDEKKTIGFRK